MSIDIPDVNLDLQIFKRVDVGATFCPNAKMSKKQHRAQPVLAITLDALYEILESAHDNDHDFAFGPLENDDATPLMKSISDGDWKKLNAQMQRMDVDIAEFNPPIKFIGQKLVNRLAYVWKFPADIAIKGIPNNVFLPVGYYWFDIDDNVKSMFDAKEYDAINTSLKVNRHSFVDKLRLDSHGIHYLHSYEHDVRIPAIASSYFYPQHGFDISLKDYRRLAEMCVKLKKECGVYAFPNHDEHHVIVFYGDPNKDVFSPETFSNFLQSEKGTKFLQILSSYSTVKSMKSWASRYIDYFGKSYDVKTLQTKYSDVPVTSKQSDTISLASYNILYSNMKDKESDIHWAEDEMLYKTENCEVPCELENIFWKARRSRIINNLGSSDIVLFQEMSPMMWKSLKQDAKFASFEAEHSEYGCCQPKRDGFAYVCWNKNKFEALSTITVDRFVGVFLKFQGITFLACSVHLPYPGTEMVKKITNILKKQDLNGVPVIIGGDFNVEYNLFEKNGFKNLSGDRTTFYNGSGDAEPEEAKFDWIVAKGNIVNKAIPSVNDVVKKEGRWPNKKEGSDHTAIRLKISFSGVPSTSLENKPLPKTKPSPKPLTESKPLPESKLVRSQKPSLQSQPVIAHPSTLWAALGAQNTESSTSSSVNRSESDTCDKYEKMSYKELQNACKEIRKSKNLTTTDLKCNSKHEILVAKLCSFLK